MKTETSLLDALAWWSKYGCAYMKMTSNWLIFIFGWTIPLKSLFWLCSSVSTNQDQPDCKWSRCPQSPLLQYQLIAEAPPLCSALWPKTEQWCHDHLRKTQRTNERYMTSVCLSVCLFIYSCNQNYSNPLSCKPLCCHEQHFRKNFKPQHQ